MDCHMRTELVSRALTMTIDARGGEVTDMIFHHDRGSQYMSREFKELCARHGVAQSVGRTDSCHDNAVAESFWATLKRKFVNRFGFESRADARNSVRATASLSRLVERARVTITPLPKASGPPLSASSLTGFASSHEPTRGAPSPAGSTTTTLFASTRQLTTCHRSSGSYNSHADRFRQHKNVSGFWGKGHPLNQRLQGAWQRHSCEWAHRRIANSET